MKKYNIQNYIRYKKDVASSIARLEGKMWDEYTRKELTIKFLPLVENIARKFSTSQQASGVMNIMDFIQSGSLGLVHAVRKLDYDKLRESGPNKHSQAKLYPSEVVTLALLYALKGCGREGITVPSFLLFRIQPDSFAFSTLMVTT